MPGDGRAVDVQVSDLVKTFGRIEAARDVSFTIGKGEIFFIARKDLLQTLKDRNSFFFMLVMPLVLITVIGFAFGNIFGSGSSQITITVALSNQDTGFLGKSVVRALQINTSALKITVNQYSDPNKVKDEVANDSNVNAGVMQ